MPDGVCSLKPSQKGQREDPVGDQTDLLQVENTQRGEERRKPRMYCHIQSSPQPRVEKRRKSFDERKEELERRRDERIREVHERLAKLKAEEEEYEERKRKRQAVYEEMKEKLEEEDRKRRAEYEEKKREIRKRILEVKERIRKRRQEEQDEKEAEERMKCKPEGCDESHLLPAVPVLQEPGDST